MRDVACWVSVVVAVGCGAPPAAPDVGTDAGADGGLVAIDAGPPDCPAVCDDGISCTVDRCDESTGRCVHEPDDVICDDGNVCTRGEMCDVRIGCLAGIRLDCEQPPGSAFCAVGCDPVTGCVLIPRDRDGDGFASVECGGGDCDDTRADVNPAAPEVCGDFVDNNCDGLADVFDTIRCLPDNDTCDGSAGLPGPGLFNVATFGLEDDYALLCETGSDNPDAIFRFRLDEASDVTVLVSGPLNVAVELRPTAGCGDDAAGLACDRITSTFGVEAEGALLDFTVAGRGPLEAGTYDLVVATPSEDFYSIDLRISPPPPPPVTDRCDDDTPAIAASTTVRGSFADHGDRYLRPPCGDGTAESPEAVHRLSLDRAMDVEVWANGEDGSGFQRDLRYAVVRNCDAIARTTLGCQKVDFAPAPRILLPALPAGEYWILVESDDVFPATTYTLDVLLTEVEDP